MFTTMFITISIIELIAIGILALKLYQKNVTIKSLKESVGISNKQIQQAQRLLTTPTVTQTMLEEENAELKAKLERYHEEASRLNRKIYQLKQELKSKESDVMS